MFFLFVDEEVDVMALKVMTPHLACELTRSLTIGRRAKFCNFLTQWQNSKKITKNDILYTTDCEQYDHHQIELASSHVNTAQEK